MCRQRFGGSKTVRFAISSKIENFWESPSCVPLYCWCTTKWVLFFFLNTTRGNWLPCRCIGGSSKPRVIASAAICRLKERQVRVGGWTPRKPAGSCVWKEYIRPATATSRQLSTPLRVALGLREHYRCGSSLGQEPAITLVLWVRKGSCVHDVKRFYRFYLGTTICVCSCVEGREGVCERTTKEKEAHVCFTLKTRKKWHYGKRNFQAILVQLSHGSW